MYNDMMIPANEFCVNHNIEFSWFLSLQENGLIEITTIEDTVYIPASRLNELERIVRLYNDLDINLEGIQTITHLLKQMNDMHHEIISLKNRLRLYETEE